LYEIIFGMAKGTLVKNSWNDAFGQPYADRKQPGGMRTRAQMFDAYREVIKLKAENKANKNKKMSSQEIYREAGKRLTPKQSGDVVKKLFGDVNRAIKKGEWVLSCAV